MSKEELKMALEAANKAMKDAIKCIEELGAKNKALEQALAEQHLQALHDENVRLGLYEQEQDRSGMTYYKNDKCKALNAADHDCICWTPAAQPEQGEPVAWALYKGKHLDSFWMDKGDAYDYKFTSEHEWKPLYTTPQQRKPLTDEEIDDVIWRSHKVESNYAGWVTDQRRIWARAIEAAHGIKEKNT
jgi:hypothetical protein